MKKGWERKKLGELCRIRTCKKDVNQGNPDGKLPFFTCAAEHTYSYSY
jgi:type I restriction enzyme S subunit